MFKLLRRLVLGSGSRTQSPFEDNEYGEFVDGAKLGEADCRWSPSIALSASDFEETRPHGMPLNAQTRI